MNGGFLWDQLVGKHTNPMDPMGILKKIKEKRIFPNNQRAIGPSDGELVNESVFRRGVLVLKFAIGLRELWEAWIFIFSFFDCCSFCRVDLRKKKIVVQQQTATKTATKNSFRVRIKGHTCFGSTFFWWKFSINPRDPIT